MNLILFDIAFVSLCEKIFLLLFDIVNLHFATFTNYLYCLLKIKVLDYCLVAFGHKKMQLSTLNMGLNISSDTFRHSEISFEKSGMGNLSRQNKEHEIIKIILYYINLLGHYLPKSFYSKIINSILSM